jgi:hypothetical protein
MFDYLFRPWSRKREAKAGRNARAFGSSKRSASVRCDTTFISELANASVPADVRRQISGHNDEKIHERYTHWK